MHEMQWLAAWLAKFGTEQLVGVVARRIHPNAGALRVEGLARRRLHKQRLTPGSDQTAREFVARTALVSENHPATRDRVIELVRSGRRQFLPLDGIQPIEGAFFGSTAGERRLPERDAVAVSQDARRVHTP